MLTKPLHQLAARPWVYDQIQNIVGLKRVVKRLSQAIAPLSPKVIVDVGGGTGKVRNLFGSDCRYVCLDLELPKLADFRSKVPDALAVLLAKNSFAASSAERRAFTDSMKSFEGGWWLVAEAELAGIELPLDRPIDNDAGVGGLAHRLSIVIVHACHAVA